MKLINSFSDAADQLITVVLDDGSIAQMEFIYRAGIQRWFFNLNHPLITLNGYGITQGPNLLRQWRNIIPFGILVRAIDFIDPIQVNDFQSGRVLLYILDATEVQTIEQLVFAPPVLANA